MNGIRLKRTSSERRSIQEGDAVSEEDRNEAALQKMSADWYERCWKSRVKNYQANWWVVGGLYLLLSSFAFVAF